MPGSLVRLASYPPSLLELDPRIEGQPRHDEWWTKDDNEQESNDLTHLYMVRFCIRPCWIFQYVYLLVSHWFFVGFGY